MPIAVGPYHMADSNDYVVQMSNIFEVQISEVGGTAHHLTLSVETANLPNISNSPVELFYGNNKVKVAGQAEFGDVTLEVKDFVGADVEAIIQKWHHKVYDPQNDKLGNPSAYKKTGYLYEYSQDWEIKRTWELRGVWPSSVEYGSFNYSGGDKKTISITLSIDRAFRNDL